MSRFDTRGTSADASTSPPASSDEIFDTPIGVEVLRQPVGVNEAFIESKFDGKLAEAAVLTSWHQSFTQLLQSVPAYGKGSALQWRQIVSTAGAAARDSISEVLPYRVSADTIDHLGVHLQSVLGIHAGAPSWGRHSDIPGAVGAERYLLTVAFFRIGQLVKACEGSLPMDPSRAIRDRIHRILTPTGVARADAGHLLADFRKPADQSVALGTALLGNVAELTDVVFAAEGVERENLVGMRNRCLGHLTASFPSASPMLRNTILANVVKFGDQALPALEYLLYEAASGDESRAIFAAKTRIEFKGGQESSPPEIL